MGSSNFLYRLIKKKWPLGLVLSRLHRFTHHYSLLFSCHMLSTQSSNQRSWYCNGGLLFVRWMRERCDNFEDHDPRKQQYTCSLVFGSVKQPRNNQVRLKRWFWYHLGVSKRFYYSRFQVIFLYSRFKMNKQMITLSFSLCRYMQLWQSLFLLQLPGQ